MKLGICFNSPDTRHHPVTVFVGAISKLTYQQGLKVFSVCSSKFGILIQNEIACSEALWVVFNILESTQIRIWIRLWSRCLLREHAVL